MSILMQEWGHENVKTNTADKNIMFSLTIQTGMRCSLVEVFTPEIFNTTMSAAMDYSLYK